MRRAEYRRKWRATWRETFAVQPTDRKAAPRHLRRLMWLMTIRNGEKQ